ncbi:DUF5343 domain-containing protein [Stenotrophomonas sp. HITSZ_GD]|uniref:DUF5343 domain-containing protein n=1 Tax=Stenotrophomonas sp. HITSZ_GD TaxID=3037248 RepID=UPI00240D53A3|nr:DUF5343 domain-containing protein [Stenotrophomonas sp. HITSZ_GD]MDG2526579.1 DUF5343 domain-containing protein [Stenotrophomonas sp. HITSZ_GD]
MADDRLPYVMAYGAITKALEKIKAAATPDRFTQDFLATKLGMKGGNAKSLIPYLKRIGFLGTDGSPSERYKRFRNPAVAGIAAAEALRQGYKPLFERNEKVHELKDNEVKGLIVEATGLEPEGSTVKSVLGSFKALKSFARFDNPMSSGNGEVEDSNEDEGVQQLAANEAKSEQQSGGGALHTKLGLSYTINLNLPATSDIAVFNAIFRSLKENLLK